MSERTVVTRINMDTISHVSVEITIERIPNWQSIYVEQKVSDLPEDVVTALREWLAKEEKTNDNYWNHICPDNNNTRTWVLKGRTCDLCKHPPI